MATIRFHQCDMDDCYNDDFEGNIAVYECSEEASEKIKEKYWVKNEWSNDFHICEECFEIINEEMPNTFKLEERYDGTYVTLK